MTWSEPRRESPPNRPDGPCRGLFRLQWAHCGHGIGSIVGSLERPKLRRSRCFQEAVARSSGRREADVWPPAHRRGPGHRCSACPLGCRVAHAEAAVRVRGSGVDQRFIDSLRAEIERVHADDDFTARAERLLERDPAQDPRPPRPVPGTSASLSSGAPCGHVAGIDADTLIEASRLDLADSRNAPRAGIGRRPDVDGAVHPTGRTSRTVDDLAWTAVRSRGSRRSRCLR